MILEVTNSYVKASDIGDRVIKVKIVSDVRFEENKYNPDQKSKVVTVMQGRDEKVLRLNATSIKQIIPVYGNETTAWINKELALQVFPTFVNGSQKEMIVAKPVMIPTPTPKFNDIGSESTEEDILAGF